MSTLISPLRTPSDIAVVEDSVVETASVILHVPPFFIAVILNSYLRSSGVTMLEPRCLSVIHANPGVTEMGQLGAYEGFLPSATGRATAHREPEGSAGSDEGQVSRPALLRSLHLSGRSLLATSTYIAGLGVVLLQFLANSTRRVPFSATKILKPTGGRFVPWTVDEGYYSPLTERSPLRLCGLQRCVGRL